MNYRSYYKRENLESCSREAVIQEALYMHQYWAEKYLMFVMSWVDGDKRIERLIDEADKNSKYWLDKYNALTVVYTNHTVIGRA